MKVIGKKVKLIEISLNDLKKFKFQDLKFV